MAYQLQPSFLLPAASGQAPVIVERAVASNGREVSQRSDHAIKAPRPRERTNPTAI